MSSYRLQWRELRQSRGVMRVTQRSCSGLDLHNLVAQAHRVAVRAYHGEFRVSGDGKDATDAIYTTLLLLDAWEKSGGRLQAKPDAIWPADVRQMSDQAFALDALRHAFSRVAISGVLSEARVSELLMGIRAEVQVLGTRLPSPWRS
jgi:hypothetical protein